MEQKQQPCAKRWWALPSSWEKNKNPPAERGLLEKRIKNNFIGKIYFFPNYREIIVLAGVVSIDKLNPYFLPVTNSFD